jgi:hypothetical protein
MELYLHSLSKSLWRGAYLSTGTTLPFIITAFGLLKVAQGRDENLKHVQEDTPCHELKLMVLRFVSEP